MRATAPLHPPPHPSPPPAPAPALARVVVRPRRPSYRRALAVGLGISLLLHLLLLLYAARTRLVVSPSSEPPPIAVVRGGGRRVMRVEHIVPVPEPAASPEEPVREEPIREEPKEPKPETPLTPAIEEAPVTTTPDRGAPLAPAERLRPRMGDSRLWRRPATPATPEPTDIERARSRIANRLGEWNDSVAAEAGRARNALDWTVADKDGGKWGISPGKIHLGDLTLPLPINFGPAPWQREEADARQRADSEILDQGARARADESFKDRVKAIRERKDRERQEKKKSGSGSGGG